MYSLTINLWLLSGVKRLSYRHWHPLWTGYVNQTTLTTMLKYIIIKYHARVITVCACVCSRILQPPITDFKMIHISLQKHHQSLWVLAIEPFRFSVQTIREVLNRQCYESCETSKDTISTNIQHTLCINKMNVHLNIKINECVCIASCNNLNIGAHNITFSNINFSFSHTEIIFHVPGVRQKCCQIFHQYISKVLPERLRTASYSRECPVCVCHCLIHAYECEILLCFCWKCLMPETLEAQIEEVSEAALIERIQMRKVKAAVDLYDQLLQAGKDEQDEALHGIL